MRQKAQQADEQAWSEIVAFLSEAGSAAELSFAGSAALAVMSLAEQCLLSLRSLCLVVLGPRLSALILFLNICLSALFQYFGIRHGSVSESVHCCCYLIA
jgi:hypothetical protein